MINLDFKVLWTNKKHKNNEKFMIMKFFNYKSKSLGRIKVIAATLSALTA
jgi:hypothetical protein